MHFIISLLLSCAVGHACLDMNSSFRSNVPAFWGSDTDNSYDQQWVQAMMPNYNNFPKTLLRQQRRFWRHFSIPAIQRLYNQALAVWQLNLPHLQHHQSPLMFKILVRPAKAQQKRAEGMESGARKRRSSLFNCGAISTHDLNRGMPDKCGKKSPKKFPKSGK